VWSGRWVPTFRRNLCQRPYFQPWRLRQRRYPPTRPQFVLCYRYRHSVTQTAFIAKEPNCCDEMSENSEAQILFILLSLTLWSPRGLRRGSTAARLLELWVRIPPRAWMSVSCECCQVEVSASGWSLVQRSPTECGVSKWVWSWNLEKWGGLGPQGAVEPLKKKTLFSNCHVYQLYEYFWPICNDFL
jgi:hypothetical protein